MINRSRTFIVLLTVLTFLFLPANVLSGRRRQSGFVDRFRRTNPFRGLMSKLASSLPIEIYYPTPPPDNQLHDFPPPQHNNRPGRPFSPPHHGPKPFVFEDELERPALALPHHHAPPRMRAPPRNPYNGIRTHYTKMPASASPSIYYAPDVTANGVSPYTQGPPAKNVPPQPQNLFLHGISYPVSSPLQQQRPQKLQKLPPVVRVQQPVTLSGYQHQPPPHTQVTYFQQPSAVSPNYESGHNNLLGQHMYYPQQQASLDSQPPASYFVPTQLHPSHSSYYSTPGLTSFTPEEAVSPTGVESETAGLLTQSEESHIPPNMQLPVEGYASPNMQLPVEGYASPNMQLPVEGYEAPSSSVDDNMLNVFVIRPQDMERLKSASDEERQELFKGYSTKFIDVEQGAQELVLRPIGQENTMQFDAQNEHESCIQPLCDPFLGKMIPELISSANLNNNVASSEDDPILIVKKNRYNSYNAVDQQQHQHLQNHRSDVILPEEMEGTVPEFTIMRAVDESDGSSAVEIMQGQHSTLKPQRIKVHFPNRKLLSAKMNATTVRNFEPQAAPVLRTYKTSVSDKLRRLQQTRSDKPATSLEKNVTTAPSFTETSAEQQTVSPKLKEFEVQKAQPYFRRGSTSKKLTPQKIVTPDGNLPNEDIVNKFSNDRGNPRKNLKSVRFTTAGILFNNNSKVPK